MRPVGLPVAHNRGSEIADMRKPKRTSLSIYARQIVRWKTGGHCHICGGFLGKDWTADHIVPHMHGGKGSVDNFLPACGVCNRLRWKYDPKEIRNILELGVYAQAEIRNKTKLGAQMKKLQKRRVDQKRKRSK